MKLSNLKPAWHRYKLLNSMQRFDRDEILVLINSAEEDNVKTNRYIISAVMFIVLTLCVQGG